MKKPNVQNLRYARLQPSEMKHAMGGQYYPDIITGKVYCYTCKLYYYEGEAHVHKPTPPFPID